MIETNLQQQQTADFREPSRSMQATGLGAQVIQVTITCAICDATYAPSPLQLPFLQQAYGALDASFLSMCHFCFRCRRASCPQCWDEVHSVCGACVQEAHLPFRDAAPILDGLLFPPTQKQPLSEAQVQAQQTNLLFMLVKPGRFFLNHHTDAGRAVDTDPRVQPVTREQRVVFDEPATTQTLGDVLTPLVPPVMPAEGVFMPVVPPVKLPGEDVPVDHDKQVSTAITTLKRKQEKRRRQVSQVETIVTWVMLILLLLIVALIALAEYIPAVNALVVRLLHIDIHAEIAYLVRIVQHVFKR